MIGDILGLLDLGDLLYPGHVMAAKMSELQMRLLIVGWLRVM